MDKLAFNFDESEILDGEESFWSGFLRIEIDETGRKQIIFKDFYFENSEELRLE
jgi:hypothetical protein